MHKVFGSNCKNKTIDDQKNKEDQEQDQNLSEAKEEDYQSHRYKKGKLYLAVLYNDRINKTDGKNDAYIILFDEKEQYKKGMELLQRCGLSRIIGREEDEVYFKAVRMEKETGLKKVPIAIFKDNTFYSEKYKRTFMHAWKGDIVLVKVIGKNENGMLVTERYAEE